MPWTQTTLISPLSSALANAKPTTTNKNNPSTTTITTPAHCHSNLRASFRAPQVPSRPPCSVRLSPIEIPLPLPALMTMMLQSLPRSTSGGRWKTEKMTMISIATPGFPPQNSSVTKVEEAQVAYLVAFLYIYLGLLARILGNGFVDSLVAEFVLADFFQEQWILWTLSRNADTLTNLIRYCQPTKNMLQLCVYIDT